MGRKPKPTKFKILEGVVNKKRINTDEPQPETNLPECPIYLNDKAKEEWYRMVAVLKRMGIITEADIMALTLYCKEYARWLEAEEYCDKYGLAAKTTNGNIIQSPFVGMAHKSIQIMMDILSEFGLTPSSRSKLVMPKRFNDEEESPMAKLLKKKVKLIG